MSCDPGAEEGRMAKIEFLVEQDQIQFLQQINRLKNTSGIISVCLYYKKSENTSIGTSNILYVKLKNGTDENLLSQAALEKNFTIDHQNRFMPLWYGLSLKKETVESSIELSNYLYETGLFDAVDPAFMFDFKPSAVIDPPCANDTWFDELWGLNNSANPAIDMNACDAWLITEGAGINVAIIDTGIQKDHIDLAANVHPLSFDTCWGQGSSPSVSYFDHGTMVAGTIIAIKGNGQFVAGIAPQSKLMDISNKMAGSVHQSEQLANGINWAVENGAHIINNSWGDQGGSQFTNLHSIILENAIYVALTEGRDGLGCVVTFGSGNHTIIDYPGNVYPDILCVGGIDRYGFRTNDSQISSFSAYGAKLDVVAPGSYIMSTANGDSGGDFGVMTGTSLASPYVAGIAALILSVNPCLTNREVNSIIEKTSQKIPTYIYSAEADRPFGTRNNEIGYGLVDAHAAVLMAQAMNSSSIDLMVRDGQNDLGIQPNPSTQPIWNSPDIWVRNQQDGNITQDHQNPQYHINGDPNYIYVRVTNKSCFASTEAEQLYLHWTLNRMWLSWPNISWNLITPVSIPILLPGEETIVSIPWVVPNPANFSSNPTTFDGRNNFSLLARIISNDDPMTYSETAVSGKLRFRANVQNNNNIAWKNLVIIDVANGNRGLITLENLSDQIQNSYLELVTEDKETGKPIFEEAEVSVKMDDILYQAWVRGGKIAQQLDPTTDEQKKLVKGKNVILDNISLNANETGMLQIDFNFLTEELTQKSNYTYHIIQKDVETGEIIGGETFIIEKHPRPDFIADAGETKVVDRNEPITISAAQISEPALYNWYDIAGNLIFTGKDLTIAAQVATKYKLEVIASADGFKDYSEVEVKMKQSTLNTITPNPAVNNVTIGYKVNEAGSAYLMIIGSYGTTGTTNNYILNINSSETTIDISNYPNGFYTVALVCSGQIIDAKTLIKN